jgi:hypothetical protein
MYLDQRAQSLALDQHQVRLVPVPDECPRCHRSIHPTIIHVSFLEGRSLCQAIYRCTHQGCQELFIATYRDAKQQTSGGNQFLLKDVSPIAPYRASFAQDISELSPIFVEIYNQAISAESNGLDQIVGIGLRKALEFLIKDFSCFKNPGKEEEIRSTSLGSCIKDYIDDINVKECAKRAVWLAGFSCQVHLYINLFVARRLLRFQQKICDNWLIIINSSFILGQKVQICLI